MAASRNPLGKYKPKWPGYAQPGTNRPLPTVNVRQDVRPTAPPKPAGGQGPVTSTPVPPSPNYPKPPDVSWKDSPYYQGESNITTGLSNLGAYLLNQSKGLGYEYGIDTGTADPTTYDPAHPPAFTVDWANVDVTNPFSRAALLKRSHQANERGNTNNYAARGQLYSGALQNAQDTEGFNYQGGQNALISDFGKQQSGLYGQWLQARQAADQQRLDNVIAAQLRNKDTKPIEYAFTGGAPAPGDTPWQAVGSGEVTGTQPPDVLSKAVKEYLKKQKGPGPKKAKHPTYGNTGGARAPGH